MREGQLEKLYDSIYPKSQRSSQDKNYEETKELCKILEKEMTELMPSDLKAMFQDYKEYVSNLVQMRQKEFYINGLALGIRITSEAFMLENEK